MKKKLSEFFNVPFNGKKKRTGIALTIVALVEVILLMVVSTSAWVESINSLKIYNLVPGVVESPIFQKVNLDSTSDDTYNLDKYFRASGAYHLTGASSADGNTMYFPEIVVPTENPSEDPSEEPSEADLVPKIYRVGGINDKNVNYISFTIRTQTAVDLAFDQVPSISFGGTALSGDYRKLVRFSIGDNSGNFKVFSLYPEKFIDENVVIDENGTKGSSAVYPFSDCVKGKDKAVTTTANGLLTFSMWIEDPAPTKSTRDVYDNKALAVSDLKLVIVKPFTVYAASTTGTNNSGDPVYELNNTGGNVAIENSAYGKQATYYAVPGQQISLHAVASATNGFQFLGWDTTNPNNNTSNDVISGSNVDPYTYTIPNDGNTTELYAKFSNVHTLYMKPEYQFKGNNDNYVRFAAYVFGINAQGVLEDKWYDMTSATWKNDNGYYKFSFQGNASTVIFCYMNKNNAANNWDNRYLQTYDLQVPTIMGEYGYHVTSRKIIGHNRGASGINEDTGYGTNLLYGFWLHNHVKINVDYTSDSPSGVAETIYPSLKDSSDVSGKAEWYDDANKNKYLFLDGKKYPVNSNSPTYSKMVTLTAEQVANDSKYVFKGWYSDQDGTNRLTTNLTYDIEAPDNNIYTGSDTENEVTYYAKYEKKPPVYYITANWNSWSTNSNMLSGTSNELTVTQELDPGTYEFKVYEGIDEAYYAKNYDFKYQYNGDTYLDSTSPSAITKNGNNGNNMKFYVGHTGKFTFHLNKSTMKFWITAESVTTWHIVGEIDSDSGWNATNNNKMSVNGTEHYKKMYVSGTKKFKILSNDGTWRSNGYGYHSGYTGPNVITGNIGDMTIDGGNGTNVWFHWDTSTNEFWISY